MNKAVILLSIFIFSCSLPTVITLKDPLTAQERVNLGYIYEKQGKLELAKKEYKKAIKKDSKIWQAYFNLGNIYASEWEFEKAEEMYMKALQLNKDNPDILNNLAYVLYKQGRKEEGLIYIERALQIIDKPEYRDTEEAIKSKF